MQLPQILAAALAVLATQVSADHPVPVENPKEVLKSTYAGKQGMNDLAKLSGKYMGTASDIFNVSEMATDAPYVTELKNKKDWGSMTSCNLMKWENIHPEEKRYTFENADKLVKIAKKLGANVRCHAFAWHGQNPSWVTTANWTKAEALQQLEKHITKVMTHFGNDCYAWDVVNEAIDDSAKFRTNNPWYGFLGESFVQTAFEIAAKVKKEHKIKSKLYYNDYNLEYPNEKSATVLKLIKEQLLGHGIDGVGFQGHFIVGKTPSKEDQIKQMTQFTELGLDVAYTELDIRTNMPPTLDVQKQHAKDYAASIAACKAVGRCVGVTIWDFDDEYSWIPVTFKGQGWGSPWFQPAGVNTALVRKAAYDAVIEGWKGCSNSTQQQQQQQKPKCQWL